MTITRMGENRERSLNKHPDIYLICICNLSKEIQISIHRKLRNERDKMRMTTRSVQSDSGFMVNSYVVTVQSCKHGLICQCHVILTQLVDAYIFQWIAPPFWSRVQAMACRLFGVTPCYWYLQSWTKRVADEIKLMKIRIIFQYVCSNWW